MRPLISPQHPRENGAHLDYLNNPGVGRLIACGLPSSALCKRE